VLIIVHDLLETNIILHHSGSNQRAPVCSTSIRLYWW